MSEPIPVRPSTTSSSGWGTRSSAYYYRKAFASRRSPTPARTGRRDAASYVLAQGQVRLVLTTPLARGRDLRSPEAPRRRREGHRLRRPDADAASPRPSGAARSRRRAAHDGRRLRPGPPRGHPNVWRHHPLVHRARGYAGRSSRLRRCPRRRESVGLLRIDHIVGNVEDRKMDVWASSTSASSAGVSSSPSTKDISTEYSALRSKVMSSRRGPSSSRSTSRPRAAGRARSRSTSTSTAAPARSTSRS